MSSLNTELEEWGLLEAEDSLLLLNDLDFDPEKFGLDRLADEDIDELSPSPSAQNQDIDADMEMGQVDNDNTSNPNHIEDAAQNKNASININEADTAEENELKYTKKDICWGQPTSNSCSGNIALSKTLSTSSMGVDGDKLKIYVDVETDKAKSKRSGAGREKAEKQIQSILIPGEDENVESNAEMYEPNPSIEDNFDEDLRNLAQNQNRLETLFPEHGQNNDSGEILHSRASPSQDPTYDPTVDFIKVNASGKKNSTTSTSTSDYSKYMLKKENPMLNSANTNNVHNAYDPRIIIPLPRTDANADIVTVKKQFPKQNSNTVQLPRILNKRKSAHNVKQDFEVLIENGKQSNSDLLICTNVQAGKFLQDEVLPGPSTTTANNTAGENKDRNKKLERKQYAKEYRKNKKDEVKKLEARVKELEEDKKHCTCRPAPAVVVVEPSRPSKKRKKST